MSPMLVMIILLLLMSVRVDLTLLLDVSSPPSPPSPPRCDDDDDLSCSSRSCCRCCFPEQDVSHDVGCCCTVHVLNEVVLSAVVVQVEVVVDGMSITLTNGM